MKFLEAGFSVLPVKKSDKKPIFLIREWNPLKLRLPTKSEINSWFNNPEAQIAIIGGKVSKGVFCLDFDLKADLNKDDEKENVYAKWLDCVFTYNQDLLKKVYVQKTVNNGFHVIYTTDAREDNNATFARRCEMITKDGKEKKKLHTLIECRTENGYFLVAPSEGYTKVSGDMFDLPHLSQKEHNLLINCARTLNQYDENKYLPVHHIKGYVGITPFQDYDESVSESELLAMIEASGWKILRAIGNKYELKRPGKRENTLGATFNYIPKSLYVFSTNSNFPEAPQNYKPYQIYTVLNHNGNYKASGADLYAQGYGDRMERAEPDKQPIPQSEYDNMWNDLQDISVAEEKYKSFLPLMKKNLTGFPTFDKNIECYIPTDVFLIAGRSGTCKTTLGLELGNRIARSTGTKCFFASLEMDVSGIYMRIATACNSEIQREATTASDVNDMFKDPSNKKLEILRKHIKTKYKDMIFLDKPGQTFASIEKYLSAIRTKHPAGVIVIDYLGYIKDTGSGSNYEKVTRVAKEMKEFAKRNQIRVVMLCQTSRKGEDGKIPVKLHHLRDSGSIEESSDYTIGIWHGIDGTLLGEFLKGRQIAIGMRFAFQNVGMFLKEIEYSKELMETSSLERPEEQF